MNKQSDDFNSLLEELSLNDLDPDDGEFIDIADDEGFEEKLKTEINDRETHYTRLLEFFIDSYDRKQKTNHWFKITFFVGMMLCLVVIIVLAIILAKTVLEIEPYELPAFLPTVITAVVSFVTGIIGIPLVITNYLFDNTEDKKLIDLIEKMQNHDIDNLNHLNRK